MQRRRLSVVAIASSLVAVVTAGFLVLGGGTSAAPDGSAGPERHGAKGGSA